VSAIAQRSFAGGEIAPALYARTDMSKYATGLRTCRNMMVQRQGGVTNRSGTEFIAEVKDSTKAVRLIEFVFNTSSANTYVLELGETYARFFHNGAAVTVSGVAAWANTTAYAIGDLVADAGVNYYCISAHTSATAVDKPGSGSNWGIRWYALTGAIYEIPTPYLAADLAGVRFVQSADVITLCHPSYAPRELKRYAATKWILSQVVINPSISPPANLAKSGGTVTAWADTTIYTIGDVRSSGGANYICAVSHTSAAALNTPGTGTNWQSYWYPAGARYWVVTAVKEGTLEESLVSVTLSGGTSFPNRPSPIVLTWDAVVGAIYYNVYRSTDGNIFGFVTASASTTVLLSDNAWTTTSSTASTPVTGIWIPSPGTQCRNALAAIGATTKPYDGKFNVYFKIAVSGPGSGYYTLGRVRVYYSRNGEARVDAGLLTSATYAVGSTGTATYTDSGSVIVPDNGYTTLTIDLVPEVYGGGGVATFTAALDETLAGFDKIEWNKTVPGYTDDGSIPQSYLIRPPTQAALFAGADKYPTAVAYYQQRRGFAQSNSAPETVWASRTGSPKNFALSTPLQDDDSVSFSLVGRQVNAIQHMLDLGRLILFTSGEEKMCEGDQSGILKPDAVNPRKLSANGIGILRPLELDDSAIYVQARGNLVRDLKPVSADSYQGTDLTVFAAHLFEGYSIVDWTFALNPHSIVWAVRSDGTLLGLTYLRDHAIWGWHRHDTDGLFENVCAVPEGIEDRVYLVAKRTINGVTKRYIERFASRLFTDQEDAVFMDAALSYDGWNTGATTMTLSGGVNWDDQELLTLTASVGTFVAGDVGNVIILKLLNSAGVETDRVRLTISSYTSATVVRGHVDKIVPALLRAVAKTTWAKAVKSVSGLSHLEGKSLSVLGDGYVVASPNNAAYPVVTVAAGVVTLPAPYAVIRAGLPFISDVETLDLDAAGQSTIKDRKILVSRVGLFIEKSRGIWIGMPTGPTAADPLAGLQEWKARSEENYSSPVDARTESIEVNIESNWNSNGRVLVRQVDPLPMTILSATPIGYLPT
jgi:hypothetical protein